MQKIDDILFIDTDEALAEFCNLISAEPLLAIDTEFIREKTYYPQLCLIQVAAGEHIACIDPLTIKSLEPMLDLVYDPQKTKIFHAARQDLEIFYQLRQQIPKPVFDTQIAATLLGFSDQCGYAALVQKLLDVQLDKEQARTDWSQRPLSHKQVHYAANDVRYLLQAYPVIIERLESAGRLEWLTDDFNAISNDNLYRTEPDSTWQRVSGHNKLKPRQLVVLQKLAAWRENTAIKSNRPRRWIMSDDVLINLAQQTPSNIAQLEKIRGINSSSVDKHGDRLINLILEAKSLPEEQWPQLSRWQRPTQEQDALSDLCMAYMKQLAFDNKLSPGILSSRKEIEKLVMGERELEIIRGWRKQLAGNALLELLEGKCSLQVVNNKLQVTASS